MKLDPYLNIDPGIMSRYQHGEVYVTDDGAETDLDLGHYERWTDLHLSKESSITSGKIYSSVLITLFSLLFFVCFLQGNEEAFTKKKDGLETILSAYFFGVIGCDPSA